MELIKVELIKGKYYRLSYGGYSFASKDINEILAKINEILLFVSESVRIEKQQQKQWPKWDKKHTL